MKTEHFIFITKLIKILIHPPNKNTEIALSDLINETQLEVNKEKKRKEKQQSQNLISVIITFIFKIILISISIILLLKLAYYINFL